MDINYFIVSTFWAISDRMHTVLSFREENRIGEVF